MQNFSDFSAWGTYLVLGMLFAALLVANALNEFYKIALFLSVF